MRRCWSVDRAAHTASPTLSLSEARKSM
jgi:hypothetical protein